MIRIFCPDTGQYGSLGAVNVLQAAARCVDVAETTNKAWKTHFEQCVKYNNPLFFLRFSSICLLFMSFEIVEKSPTHFVEYYQDFTFPWNVRYV